MSKNQQNVWLKAAVIGSIWASFEIIFGGFFHSLRLPFAGTFLTFTSIVLLIAFSYKWQDKNLFIKAGLIAALMRSLMPTSIILGPLIGILVEAVIFQWAINIFGRNLFSFALAGILAMYGALLHKVVSIILIYGFDIVKILENLYYVLLRVAKINLPLSDLLWLVGLTYALFGILAAVIGQYVGRKLVYQDTFALDSLPNFKIKNDLFTINHFNYNARYIIFHLVILVIFLTSLEIYPLGYSLLPVFLYMIFLFKHYGSSLKRLAKPFFWVQLLLIILITIWVWDDKWEGLLIGFKMILRAVLVVSIFTAISVELKNPFVKAVLYKKGYSQFYSTLGIATSAVPFILKNISNNKKVLFNPFKVLRKAISLSDVLFQIFSKQIKQNNKIFVITGSTGSGKTSFLNNLLHQISIHSPELRVGGIIAHGVDLLGQRFGFKIENISTGQKMLLSSIQKDELFTIKVGRYYFSKEALQFGHDALSNDIDNLDVLVVDEIGHLELKGKGWFVDIEQAMMHDKLTLIIVIRETLLNDVLKLWQDKHFIIIDVKQNTIEHVVKML
jgi:nucleoside-triphosphatase THEP1